MSSLTLILSFQHRTLRGGSASVISDSPFDEQVADASAMMENNPPELKDSMFEAKLVVSFWVDKTSFVCLAV